jgi:hypothetical protein
MHAGSLIGLFLFLFQLQMAAVTPAAKPSEPPPKQPASPSAANVHQRHSTGVFVSALSMDPHSSALLPARGRNEAIVKKRESSMAIAAAVLKAGLSGPATVAEEEEAETPPPPPPMSEMSESKVRSASMEAEALDMIGEPLPAHDHSTAQQMINAIRRFSTNAVPSHRAPRTSSSLSAAAASVSEQSASVTLDSDSIDHASFFARAPDARSRGASAISVEHAVFAKAWLKRRSGLLCLCTRCTHVCVYSIDPCPFFLPVDDGTWHDRYCVLRGPPPVLTEYTDVKSAEVCNICLSHGLHRR